MGGFLPFLMLAGGLAAVMGFFTWVAVHVRRRGLAGAAVRAAMASYDEAFRVTAHESYYEVRAQSERKAPLLSPDGQGRPSDDAAGRRVAASRRPRQPRPRRGRGELRRLVDRLRRVR
ncbi:hypothetical protein [Streptomyces sp. NPDC001970]